MVLRERFCADFVFCFAIFCCQNFFTVEMYIYAFRDCIPCWRCALFMCIAEMVERDGVGYDVRQWQLFGVTG